MTMTDMTIQIATLANGCFWCSEAIFKRLKGVKSVLPGYSGGIVENPSYEQVCTGKTGHTESIQIEFDPTVIPYEKILDVFWHTHDPTTLNRQGADVGTQYRSAIFYHNEEQRKVAEQTIAEINAAHIWNAPIVTEVTPLQTFYKAEDYHQEYYQNNPNQGYCRIVIAPKVTKFRKQYLA